MTDLSAKPHADGLGGEALEGAGRAPGPALAKALSQATGRWVPTTPSADNPLGPFHLPRTGAGALLAGGEPQPLLVEQTLLVVELAGAGSTGLRDGLAARGYAHVVCEDQPDRVVSTALHWRPSLVLLDVTDTPGRGLELLRELRAEPDLDAVPVIALVTSGDAARRIAALEAGATDFLALPADPTEALLRVRNGLVLKVYQDRLASNDPVTGLPNRRVFHERVRSSLHRAAAAGTRVALLHVALDHFEPVTSRLGLAAADHLASRVGRRLAACVRRDDDEVRAARLAPALLCRLDHDSFAVLLPEIALPDTAARVARRVLEALSRPLRLGRDDVTLRPAVGIAVSPEDGLEPEAVMAHAAAAAAHAQHMGSHTYRFHAMRFNEVSIERLKLETRLRGARERGELQVFWQPQVDRCSGRIGGAEALLRWRPPGQPAVDPERFLPMAEETGMIVGFGEWVVEEACSQWRRWRGQGLGPLRVAVNVSARELAAGRFASVVAQAMGRHGLGRGDLAIELHERVLGDPSPTIVAQLDALREAGCHLSIAEFGLGDLSMAGIGRVPLDELKIDRSFTAGLPHAHADTAIVRAMVVLGHSLGLQLVAEGIEHPEQLRAARELGIDRLQGYLLGRPMPADEFGLLVRVLDLDPQPLGNGLGGTLASD